MAQKVENPSYAAPYAGAPPGVASSSSVPAPQYYAAPAYDAGGASAAPPPAAPHTVVDFGAKSGAPSSPPEGAGYADFMDRRVRHGFIRKVYAILAAQLAFTFAVTFVFVLSTDVTNWVKNNPGVYFAALALQIVFMIALVCFRENARKVPLNYVLLAAFTVCETYLVGTISSFYSTNSVLIAFGICVGMTLALTAVAWQTKYDFTAYLGCAVVAVWSLIIFGILMIWLRSQILNVVYGTVGAIIFGVRARGKRGAMIEWRENLGPRRPAVASPPLPLRPRRSSSSSTRR